MWKTVPFHVKKEFFRGLMQSLAFRKNGKRNNANKQANKLIKGNKQNEKKKKTEKITRRFVWFGQVKAKITTQKYSIKNLFISPLIFAKRFRTALLQNITGQLVVVVFR